MARTKEKKKGSGVEALAKGVPVVATKGVPVVATKGVPVVARTGTAQGNRGQVSDAAIPPSSASQSHHTSANLGTKRPNGTALSLGRPPSASRHGITSAANATAQAFPVIYEQEIPSTDTLTDMISQYFQDQGLTDSIDFNIDTSSAPVTPPSGNALFDLLTSDANFLISHFKDQVTESYKPTVNQFYTTLKRLRVYSKLAIRQYNLWETKNFNSFKTQFERYIHKVIDGATIITNQDIKDKLKQVVSNLLKKDFDNLIKSLSTVGLFRCLVALSEIKTGTALSDLDVKPEELKLGIDDLFIALFQKIQKTTTGIDIKTSIDSLKSFTSSDSNCLDEKLKDCIDKSCKDQLQNITDECIQSIFSNIYHSLLDKLPTEGTLERHLLEYTVIALLYNVFQIPGINHYLYARLKEIKGDIDKLVTKEADTPTKKFQLILCSDLAKTVIDSAAAFVVDAGIMQKAHDFGVQLDLLHIQNGLLSFNLHEHFIDFSQFMTGGKSKRKNFNKCSLKELKEKAKSRKIKKYSKMNKSELIQALRSKK